MLVKDNSIQQINAALLDIQKSNEISDRSLKSLTAAVAKINDSLNETKAGLDSGKTYDINISGNAATATRATTADNATHATSADSATSAATATSATTATTALSSNAVDKTWLVNTIYPVGAIYLSVNNVNPGTFLGGTWIAVGSGKVLQGADATHTGGTEIAAGLPNITGTTPQIFQNGGETGGTGATKLVQGTTTRASIASGSYKLATLEFDANASNNIYGSSTTVQPPAYCVYIFKRTA